MLVVEKFSHEPVSHKKLSTYGSFIKINTSVSVFVYDVKTEKNSVLPNIYDVSIVYD